jgi:hypothetical protein
MGVRRLKRDPHFTNLELATTEIFQSQILLFSGLVIFTL